MVDVDGRLVRACATPAAAGMKILTGSQHATDARREAAQRLIANHELYCTICDYNSRRPSGTCEWRRNGRGRTIGRQTTSGRREDTSDGDALGI